MDPKFRGQRLTAEHEENAEMWLSERHSEYLTGVMAFKIYDPEYYLLSIMQVNVIPGFSSQKWWYIMSKKCEKQPVSY